MSLFQEYLKDLGVKALGDVIAILRHSGKVQARFPKDCSELLSDNKAEPETPAVMVDDGSRAPGAAMLHGNRSKDKSATAVAEAKQAADGHHPAAAKASRTVTTTGKPLQTSGRILEKRAPEQGAEPGAAVMTGKMTNANQVGPNGVNRRLGPPPEIPFNHQQVPQQLAGHRPLAGQSSSSVLAKRRPTSASSSLTSTPKQAVFSRLDSVRRSI